MARTKTISIEINLNGLMTVYQHGNTVTFVYEDGRSLKIWFRTEKDAKDRFACEGELLINNPDIHTISTYCAQIEWHMPGEVNNVQV